VSGLNYDAARADTYQQLLLPCTFWGWLNVTPYAGGRFTYYTEAHGPGGGNSEASRSVFDTGVDVSFKASRLWSTAKSKLLDLNGLRHIVEPSIKYIYVPEPHDLPHELPQFDYTIPSLRLLPIGFPEFNSIDSIDREHTLRFGLRNTLQTKRGGELAEMLNWEVITDWNICTRTNQTCFSDVYSLLTFAPRSWLTFGSETSFDTDEGRWRLAYNTLSFTPSHVWQWRLGYYYLHDDPQLGTGNNLISSGFAYRLNENWSVRLSHRFEARDGRMEEQEYGIYRDLRSWTTELLFRWRDNRDHSDDFTVAFVLSLKAYPRQFGSGGSSKTGY
jgi:LPS-assembly protein